MSAPRKVETAIRFPPGLHARLKEAAGDRDLSMNFLVVHAVREFLEKLSQWEAWR